MSNSRLLVIGLDAADKDLIEEWAASGDMPTFKNLLESSVWGDVENPRGLEAGSCWPTFYFGLSPSVTSQFDGGRHFDPEKYEEVGYQPEKSRVEPVWTVLSKAGKTCGVIDAPYSYPTDEINGMKVVDRSGHVPSGSGNYMDFRTYPPELADEINAKFGPDPAGGHSSDYIAVDSLEGARAFRDLYVNRVGNKAELSLHYWKQQPWDFFMTVFTEAHCVGHRCWHLHDVNHPDHDPEIARVLGDPVKDAYIALDQAVGKLIAAAKDEARVIVYLSHGMGPRVTATKLLDRILVRLENKGVSTQADPVMKMVRAAWRSMPDAIRRPLWGLRDKVSHDGFQPNRKGRRYFEVFANDRTGGIRINLVGRESHGIVQPGDEYDAVCDQLVADLREVKNAETGEPLIAEIQRVKDSYKGECIDYLPDILVTWNQSNPINEAHSAKIGTVDVTGLITSWRSGDHRPAGRFFGVAPDWPHEHLNQKVKAEDFVPTMTGLFSVDLKRTDGHTISALMDRSN
ncbi:MAG: alkaline phosphatase family protein [Rhodospirillales bacterium]|nr:alkaline phosphatase family protein [Rhodospirillales bacterium]